MYYYDGAAKAGCYPLDERLQIRGAVSAGVERQVVRLSAILAYESAARVLEELTLVKVSDTTVWRRVQQAGQRVRACEAERMSAAATAATATAATAGEPGQDQLGTTMDGVMVHVRGEGWKEVKIGCVFEVAAVAVSAVSADPAVSPRLNPAGEPLQTMQAHHQSYVFHLGGPEAFGVKLDAEATARGWSHAATTSVTADGAEWIWNLADQYFARSAHVVDWYHAKTHLWNAAHAVSATDPAAAVWVRPHADLLYSGQANRLADHLDQLRLSLASPDACEVLRVEAGYFRTHHERMQYRDFQAVGLPIGSGTVESGAKQFKARYCQSGMRWSRAGLQNAMPFRAAVMSQRFDALWNAACPC